MSTYSIATCGLPFSQWPCSVFTKQLSGGSLHKITAISLNVSLIPAGPEPRPEGIDDDGNL